jgi:phage gpG-like protein
LPRGEQFIILDNGETVITGEWVPPPDEFAARLLGLSRSLENLYPILVQAKALAIESTEAHFDSETDPSDIPWAPLSREWAVDKRKVESAHPDEILQLTGEGKRAAISEDSYFITDDELWFNPERLPFYMAYHQRGTQHAGAVSALEAANTEARNLTSKEAKLVSQHYGRGKNLPKREFIGFSEIDELVLAEAFNTWFASNIEIFFPPEFPTEPSATGFNILGEFPIVGFTKRGQPLLRTPAGIRFGRKM